MAAADIAKVLSVPGFLCVNPTDLSVAFPCGGTALGAAHQIYVMDDAVYSEVPAEEWGGEPADLLFVRETLRLMVTFRGDDADAVAAWAPNYTTVSSRKGASYLGTATKRPGSLMADRAVKLLFYPDQPTVSQGVLIYRAIPFIAKGARRELGHKKIREYSVGFLGIRRESDKSIYQQLLVADMSL